MTRRYRGSHDPLPIPSLEQWIDPTEAIITLSNTLTVNSGTSSSSSSRSSSEKSNGGSSSSSNSHDNNRATPVISHRGKDEVRKKSSTVTMESADNRKNADKSISNILDDIARKLNVDSADLLQQADTELENAGYYCRAYS